MEVMKKIKKIFTFFFCGRHWNKHNIHEVIWKCHGIYLEFGICGIQSLGRKAQYYHKYTEREGVRSSQVRTLFVNTFSFLRNIAYIRKCLSICYEIIRYSKETVRYIKETVRYIKETVRNNKETVVTPTELFKNCLLHIRIFTLTHY